MKFSDVVPSTWSDLRPYVDTCLLPVTGLTGEEQPWEATQALEELRDALDCFEIPYKGRVLTYPAFHYSFGQQGEELLASLCERLKQSYPHVILVTAKEEAAAIMEAAQVDAAFVLPPAMITNSSPDMQREIAHKLQQIWAKR
jgi:23S rRNA (pseudouridine1915-N3)-methyltransferase